VSVARFAPGSGVVRLQDCAAGADLSGGNASREYHHESIAVGAVQCAIVMRQGGEEVLDDLIVIGRPWLLVGDVDLVAAHHSET
jgi:hypothetical protein